MRVEWELDGFSLPASAINAQFQPIADRLNMRWELHFSDDMPRMAVFVSKQGHCLYDIAGALPIRRMAASKSR